MPKVFESSGTGLHWDEIDEDIRVEGLLQGIGYRTRITPNRAE